jgi:proteic killer suppression protein
MKAQRLPGSWPATSPLTRIPLRPTGLQATLKSVGLHKLKGDRKGQWAMTVNERWHICFEFQKGDAFEVEIVDYHRG